MNKLMKISSVAALLLPSSAFAQTDNILQLVGYGRTIVDGLLILVAGIALLAFFWGLVRFVFKLGGEADIEQGRKLMIWGLIALFVMVSVWGLIRFIEGEIFGDLDTTDPNVPGFGP